MKRNHLTRAERLQFSLPQNLKNILVGLILGDVCIRKQKTSVNVNLQFSQGILHKEYLMLLYGLFKTYCGAGPKIIKQAADKRTGKNYSKLAFQSFALPCFVPLFNLFYFEG